MVKTNTNVYTENAEQPETMKKTLRSEAALVTRAVDYILTFQKTFRRIILLYILQYIEKKLGRTLLITPLELPPALENSFETGDEIKNYFTLKQKGLLKKIEAIKNPPDEPNIYITTAESVGSEIGIGAHFYEPAKALTSAVGEMVERHIWSTPLTKDIIIKGSIRDLEAQKHSYLDPFSLVGFSDKQKKESALLHYTVETIFGWLKGYSLSDKKSIYVPTQIVSRSYAREHQVDPQLKWLPHEKEPILRWCVSTGLAAGKNLESTLLAGILEIIERDAFMITYLNRLSPARLDLPYLSKQSENLASIFSSFKKYRIRAELLQLPSDFPVKVFLTILIDETGIGPRISIGAAAGFHTEKTIQKSLSEALLVFRSIRSKLSESTRIGPKEDLELESRLLHWAKKKNTNDIHFLLIGKVTEIDLENEEEEQPQKRLHVLLEKLKEKKYQVCYVELTTKEVTNKTGWHVTQCVIPELQPLHFNETIPYFGGKRLHEIPEMLGFTAASELNTEPHPFP